MVEKGKWGPYSNNKPLNTVKSFFFVHASAVTAITMHHMYFMYLEEHNRQLCTMLIAAPLCPHRGGHFLFCCEPNVLSTFITTAALFSHEPLWYFKRN